PRGSAAAACWRRVKPRRSGRLDGRSRRGPGGLMLQVLLLQPFHVLGEQTFFPLHLLVVDGFPVLEGSEPVAFDAGEVDEHVLPFGVDDKPEALLGIEPLDVSRRHGRSPTNARRESRALAPACGATSWKWRESSAVRYIRYIRPVRDGSQEANDSKNRGSAPMNFRFFARVALTHIQQPGAPAPCAAVIDIHLPDISGLIVAQKLRSRFGATIPIIVVSGDTSMETIKALSHIGATYFFSKPISAAALVEQLKTLTGGRNDKVTR